MINLDLRNEIDHVNSKILLDDLISPLISSGNMELINHTMEFDGNGSGIIKLHDIETNFSDVCEELEWYYSLSPKTHKQTTRMNKWNSRPGLSNSNYGFIVYSAQNGLQYDSVVNELAKNPDSRRAVINYTHPFIQYVGKYDYICTQYVSYFIRDNKLNGLVSMRSNDVLGGLIYCDLYWQLHVLNLIAKDLDVKADKLYWHSTNIHIYEQDKIKLNKLNNRG